MVPANLLMQQFRKVALLVILLTGMAGSFVKAAPPVVDNALPLLTQAREQLLKGNIDWLNYHIPVLNPPQREPLLYVLLSQYYQINREPVAALRPWLTQLAEERPRVTQKSTLSGFEVTTPRYDYPALARAILRRWQEVERREHYAHLLREGRFDWHKVFYRDNALLLAQQQDVVHALSLLTPKQLLRAEQQTRGDLYFPDNSVRAALALLLQSPKLLQQLFQQPIDQYSVDAARYIAYHFPPELALSVLKKAVSIKPMRDYALRNIIGLSKRSPKAAEYLHQQESHHHLGSAIKRIRKQLQQSSQS